MKKLLIAGSTALTALAVSATAALAQSTPSGNGTTYAGLITSMESEISDFQNNFAIPATVALLGLIAVMTAIRWIRGMFRAAA